MGFYTQQGKVSNTELDSHASLPHRDVTKKYEVKRESLHSNTHANTIMIQLKEGMKATQVSFIMHPRLTASSFLSISYWYIENLLEYVS